MTRRPPIVVTDDQLLQAHDWWMSGSQTLNQLASSLGISSGSLFNRWRNMGLPRKWENGHRRRSGLAKNARYGLYINYLLAH